MLKSLRLIAALLACLAVPALAQTPATPTPARPAPPPAGAPARPMAPAPAATPAPAPAATPAVRPAASGSRIDINSATEQQLDALPGIGPVRAKAIVAGRPYADFKDLVTKNVLTQGVLDGIKDRIALANINTSTEAQLAKALPGVGLVRAKQIVSARPYATPQDLVAKKALSPSVFDKIKDMIAY